MATVEAEIEMVEVETEDGRLMDGVKGGFIP
jgi:hypothetical protein